MAGQLIDSLDDETDPDAEALWETEIAKRVDELDSGAVSTVPWFEARRRILGGS